MDVTRCHKFLLIWKEGKYQDRYFKLHIDPATESGVYDLLKLVHNRFLLSFNHVNEEEEQAIMQVSTRLGLDGWTITDSDAISIWAGKEISAGGVCCQLGWDRIFVTGIAPFNYQ